MRSRSAALAPALFAIPWVLAAACGEPAAPAQSPVVVAPSASSAPAPVAEAAPDAAPTASAAPAASTTASAEPVATTADAGAATSGGKKIPSLRQGATSVNGRLPPEVIQRIVRQNFGRFRACYEKGLKANPTLEGRVTVKFNIDRAGAVTNAEDGGSSLPHAETVSCVVKHFANMSFPQPEGGNVTVVYPIIFALTEAPPPRAAASGNMWGDSIGDAFGAGGLGLVGVGEGGGRGEGIGLGNIGTLGHGAGTGQGFGTGKGTGAVPSIRQGATSVNGRLPPEIIQRIVRQNFGRFRLCYENGLRTNPKLQGRVAVKFVIDEKGAVSDAKDGGSDLPDAGVVSCVVRGVGNLTFPKPEGGVVTVVYPLLFSPGDTPAPAPAPAPATSGSASK